MSKSINCGTFCRQLYHFQADELSEAEHRLCLEHLDACETCARQFEVEQEFARCLRRRLRREEAPRELVERVRAALHEEASPLRERNWIKAPWVAAMAASVVLAIILIPAVSDVTRRGLFSDVVEVEHRATIVDLVCDQAGYTLEQQRACLHPRHVNALKLGGDTYWNVSLDQRAGRQLATDREMRGHVLLVEGALHTGIRTLQVTGYSDLGLETNQSRAGPRPGLAGHSL